MKTALYISLGVVLCFVNREALAQRSPNPPNIVFIMADDLGIGDIGPYGQQIIRTPHLNQLASEGMKFIDFYAGSTVCAPSRASLMTGQHTGHTHVRGNGEFPLDPDQKILPEMLRGAGYTNAMFGKWGLGLSGTTGSPEKRGWDYFVGHLHHVDAHYQRPDSLDQVKDGVLKRIKVPKGAYANDLFTEEAIHFIKNQPQEKPFFLYLSFTIPHAELVVPERYMEAYLTDGGDSMFPDEKPQPEGRHYGPQAFPKAAYAALVKSVDDYVGQVMRALKERGMDENTLVIFTSDNGTHVEGGRLMEDVALFESSGEYRGVKRDLYDGGIKEPFIVRWPKRVKPDATSKHRAAFWDIYPTLAELCGQEVDDVNGISFLPTLLGKRQKDKHEYLYWEFHEFGGKQALLKGNWKVVRLNVGSDPNGPVELYHLKKDPSESQDVASEFTKKTAELTQLIDKVRTSSPLFGFSDDQ